PPSMGQGSATAVPLFAFAMLAIPILLFLFWLYAAAQTRTVSEVGIRGDPWKFVRPFNGIIWDDISEIAVGTLITERPPQSGRVEARTRASNDDVVSSTLLIIPYGGFSPDSAGRLACRAMPSRTSARLSLLPASTC